MTKRSRVSFEDSGTRATFVIRNVTLSEEATKTHVAAGGAVEGTKRRFRHFRSGTSVSIQHLYNSVYMLKYMHLTCI